MVLDALSFCFVFFFNDTATTEIYTLSLHDALPISMIVATPRPSSPSRRAAAPWNSTSEDGSERVPSLSFRRWNSIPGPRSSTKHDRPAGAWASTRKTSHGGYEQNHLWPVSSHQPSPAGSARVVFARTSEPPCFSVIAIPHSSPAMSRGSHSAASEASVRSAGTAE